MTNLSPFGPPLSPAERALLERLDALAELDQERAERWSAFFAQSDCGPDVVLRALDSWLHLRRGLTAPGALSVPLFQLLVARWAYGDRCAFEEREQRYSFSELETLTAGRAERWSAAGVGPKTVVCLGRSLGVPLLLDLLAVLRLGGCACWVPPLGEPFEKAAIAAAQPDFVSGVDPLAAALVPKAKALDASAGFGTARGARAIAASYAANDPCLLVFSPLQAGAELAALSPPSPIAAAQLLRALGRDAAFVWCLRAGDRLAAPGLAGHRHQPLLVLAALLSGACFHFASGTTARAPGDDLCGSYRMVGLSGEARQALRKKPANAKCELWSRVLEESGSEHEGRARDPIADPAALSQRVSFDPELGAVALVAPDRSEAGAESAGLPILEAPAYPALGQDWALVPLPGAAPGDTVGLLAWKAPHSAPPYLLVRSRAGGGVLYWATQGPRRGGEVFPGGSTCAAVTQLPGVLGAAVVAAPSGSAVASWRFGLLVFVAASTGVWDERRAHHVERLLTSHVERVLASELRPDFVQVFPIQPKRGSDGAVDPGWAAAERWSGGLNKRAELEVFRRLAFVSPAPSP